MLYGIGIDLVRISRISAAIDRHGCRFAERILGEYELEEYAESRHKARFAAKHFAAKEALLKALGTGLRMGIHHRHHFRHHYWRMLHWFTSSRER